MGRPIHAARRSARAPGLALRRAIVLASFGAGASFAANAMAGDKPPPTLPGKPVTTAAPAAPAAAASNSQAARAAAMKAQTSPSASPGGSASPAASGSAAPADKQKQAAKAWAAVNGINLKAGKMEERLEALRLKIETRRKTFAERRDAEQDRIRIRWGALVDRPSVQEELRLHAMRIARLTRIQELAEVEGKDPVEARALKAIDRENARHDRRMQELAMTPAAIPGGPK
jgi:hypothetical protein